MSKARRLLKCFAPAWLVLLSVFGISTAAGQCPQIADQQLLAPAGTEGDEFGFSVAIDGDTAVIGSPYSWGTAPASGSASVWGWNGWEWVFVQELAPPASRARERVGASVAVHGEVIAVGADWTAEGGLPYGAVYVYRRQGAQWILSDTLTAADREPDDRFGWAVSMDSDRLVVSANTRYHAPGDQAKVYVYTSAGGTWTLEQELLGAASQNFGNSISIDRDTIFVGRPKAPGSGPEGAVDVYRLRPGGWVAEQTLRGIDAGHGRSVDVTGDLAAVGAQTGWVDGPFIGAAYVYRLRDDAWTEDARIESDLADDGFGWAVAIEGHARGDLLLVGVPWYLTIQAYRHDGMTWNRERTLLASGVSGSLGEAIAIDDTRALAGDHFDDSAWRDAGAAYFFKTEKLTLSAFPSTVPRGGSLELVTLPGKPGAPVLLALVGIDDSGLFQPITLGTFDQACRWSVSGPVPPGLSGLRLTFQSIGIGVGGDRLVTNRRQIRIL